MNGRLIQQTDLLPSQRDAMFTLLATHFDGVTREQFDCDLAEKNWAVLIEKDQTLVGFSTLLVQPVTIAEEQLTMVCSGDTIVTPSAWGSMAFPRTWIKSVYELRRFHPQGRLIWLLLTSGFRTYRFLPVFWREFYPRVGVETPEAWQKLLIGLAQQRFDSQFDATSDIVRFKNPQRLRPHLADACNTRMADPNVEFFTRRNPGFIRGDELVCIADLDPSNLTDAGRRVVYGASR